MSFNQIINSNACLLFNLKEGAMNGFREYNEGNVVTAISICNGSEITKLFLSFLLLNSHNNPITDFRHHCIPNNTVTPIYTHPGGHFICLPPITCKWRWYTLCAPCSPSFITIRNPSGHSFFPTIWATYIKWPKISFWSSRALLSLVNPSRFFGMTTTWIGACGFMSRNAKDRSSSCTLVQGHSPLVTDAKCRWSKKRRVLELRK